MSIVWKLQVIKLLNIHIKVGDAAQLYAGSRSRTAPVYDSNDRL